MIKRKNDLEVQINEKMRGGDGSVKLAMFGELPMHMRFAAEVTLGKGDEIGYHTHTGETELYYFIEGTANVNNDGEETTMTAGDVMFIGNGAGHSVKNVSDVPVRMIAVVITEA